MAKKKKMTKAHTEDREREKRKLSAITAVKKIGHLYPVECANAVALIAAI